jgi:anti-sigma factor RsiW
MMTDHPETDVLISLLSGELSADDSDGLLRHIAECPRCHAAYEDIWSQTLSLPPTDSGAADPASASRVERDLLRRLHRVRLTENVVELASHGFLFVMLRLIQPIADVFSSAKTKITRNYK